MTSAGLPEITILCKGVTKTYIRDTILSQVTFSAHSNDIIAITGPNGSGKSTLLHMLSGHNSPTTGDIVWQCDNHAIDIANWHTHLSMAAPYLDLIDEYTVVEMIAFHFGFKHLHPACAQLSHTDIATAALLADHTHKQVKNLSSGMKQRLKLTVALLSATPVVLLDEPTTNLDTNGKTWFAELLINLAPGRLIFIATNEPFDINLCNRSLDVMEMKPA